MNGLCSEQSPPAAAAEKPSKSCLLCPKCNATTCKYGMSKSDKNPGRYYYNCPASDHNFFKWKDQVEPHELIQVPYCGGCGAGLCRVRRESAAGPNKGRIMFTCTVKEGEGSCGYRVWKDDLEKSKARETVTGMDEESKQRDEGMDLVLPLIKPPDDVCEMDQFQCVEGKSNTTLGGPNKRSRRGEGSCSFRVWLDEAETSGAEEIMSPFQSGIVKCNKANVAITDSVHIKEGVEGTHPVSPSIEPPRELISQNHEAVSHKRSRYDDIIATPDRIESSFAVQDSFENRCGSVTPSRNSKGVESYRRLSFNAEQHHSPIDSSCVRQDNTLLNSGDALASARSLVVAESYSKSTTRGIVSNSISNAIHRAAKCLQDELFNRLESMDAKDHEAMSEEAEATFLALGRLEFDYEDFKKRVKELIGCASQLVETNDTKHIRSLQEEISSTKARLSQIESEVSCCEVEKRRLELELEKISEKKMELEGKYLIACKEVEESQKLLQQKETEQNVAKAEFYKARALLRQWNRNRT